MESSQIIKAVSRNLRSIPYRKRLRTRPNPAEYTEIIRWCIGNANAYRTQQRSVFYADLKAFATQLGLDIKSPGRTVSYLIEKHRKKRADQLTKSGVAVSESDLDQAL